MGIRKGKRCAEENNLRSAVHRNSGLESVPDVAIAGRNDGAQRKIAPLVGEIWLLHRLPFLSV